MRRLRGAAAAAGTVRSAGTEPESAEVPASLPSEAPVPAVPDPPLSTIGILRTGAFLILYLNATVVFLGVMAQTVARSWLAFQLTGSNAALGGVLLAFGVTMLIATPWGGEASDRSPLGELVDGVRYVIRRPDLSALLWCGIGVTMVGLPYLAFLPTVASDLFDLGSAGYGILSATSAVGAVLTGLLLGRRSSRAHETRLFTVAAGVFGVALAGLALAPIFAVA